MKSFITSQIFFVLQESVGQEFNFIVHAHKPRNGSPHFDLRFVSRDEKTLHSFAFGKDFPTKIDSKIVGVRTKDHDKRWLTLDSYRLDTFDKGKATILIASSKYFELEFFGDKLKGKYKLFKIKSKRDDNWMLYKVK